MLIVEIVTVLVTTFISAANHVNVRCCYHFIRIETLVSLGDLEYVLHPAKCNFSVICFINHWAFISLTVCDVCHANDIKYVKKIF